MICKSAIIFCKCYFVKRFLIGFKKFFYFFLNIPKNGQKVKQTAGGRAAFAAVSLPNIEKRAYKRAAARSGAAVAASVCTIIPLCRLRFQ